MDDDWLDLFFLYLDGKIKLDDLPETESHNEHGDVVHIDMAADGDWITYADGYKEYFSIGD